MKNALKRIGICLIAVCLMSGFSFAWAAQDGFESVYTYTYDFWGDFRESPDAYRVKTIISTASLGLEVTLKSPQGLFVQGDDIYVCDTGNNRILHLEHKGDGYTLKRIISSFTGDISPLTFSSPQDIFVNGAGEMFICDTQNGRVLKLDKDLNFIRAFTKPTDATFDQSLSFLPTKVVSDSVGRVFILGKNVNKGLIKFENDGRFTGFVGASEAKYSWYDYIWKTVFSTAAQRAQQAAFVPTEYENISMDSHGFIYAVTTVFAEGDLINDKAKPIRRLNSLGADILIKNGEYPPIGDLDWSDAYAYTGFSKLTDITVFDNDVYVALDRTRGRLFGYDEQGRLLWAFGGMGNMDGYFLKPTAIDRMGFDLLVLDAQDCSITVFTPTPFGTAIFEATNLYQQGKYDESAEKWQAVLLENGNYDLAYIGIGRALMRQENYEQAMAYFKLTRDTDNYSKAFKLYRKQWVEEHIVLIFLLVAAVLVVPLAVGKIKKIKLEVENA